MNKITKEEVVALEEYYKNMCLRFCRDDDGYKPEEEIDIESGIYLLVKKNKDLEDKIDKLHEILTEILNR